MILILGFKMTAVSQKYISSAKLEMHKICLYNPFVSPLTPLLNLQHKKKKHFLLKEANKVRNGSHILVLSTCCTVILHFETWAWMYCQELLIFVRLCLQKQILACFPTSKGIICLLSGFRLLCVSKQQNWMSVNLLTIEIFRRKKCELEGMSVGTPIIYDFIIDQEGFVH